MTGKRNSKTLFYMTWTDGFFAGVITCVFGGVFGLTVYLAWRVIFGG